MRRTPPPVRLRQVETLNLRSPKHSTYEMKARLSWDNDLINACRSMVQLRAVLIIPAFDRVTADGNSSTASGYPFHGTRDEGKEIVTPVVLALFTIVRDAAGCMGKLHYFLCVREYRKSLNHARLAQSCMDEQIYRTRQIQ